MNIGHLAFDQPANKDVIRVAKRAGAAKNLRRLTMAPPAAANLFARNEFSQRGDWTPGRFEHDPVPLHKSKSFPRRHRMALRCRLPLQLYFTL
jgi:hypothetical protein